MTAMESAEWRPYRRHLIIARRRTLLRPQRYEVWDGGTLVGTFPDLIAAELHVDRRIESRPAAEGS